MRDEAVFPRQQQAIARFACPSHHRSPKKVACPGSGRIVSRAAAIEGFATQKGTCQPPQAWRTTSRSAREDSPCGSALSSPKAARKPTGFPQVPTPESKRWPVCTAGENRGVPPATLTGCSSGQRKMLFPEGDARGLRRDETRKATAAERPPTRMKWCWADPGGNPACLSACLIAPPPRRYRSWASFARRRVKNKNLASLNCKTFLRALRADDRKHRT